MKRIIVSVVLAASAVGTSFSQKLPNLYPVGTEAARMEQWVDSVFDSMTLEERIGQLFIPHVMDMRNNARNNELLRSYVEDLHVGGILFSKGTAVQQAAATNRLQSMAKVPLLMTLDGEWGLAMRLTDAPRFPHNMMLGAIANDSLIEAYGREVGRECREMGIHVNFAPVLDANSNPDNPVINTRSFGEQPDLVASKATAYARGLESQGVMATGKHFPGHGDTSTDSHLALPYVDHSLKRIENFELVPFRRFIDDGHACMMVGHLAVKALDDSNTPASLSPAIVEGKLKGDLGFGGLIFTDGLAMKGVSSEPDMCIRALEAGNDILLGPANTTKEVKALIAAAEEGRISMELIEEKVLKVLRYKYIAGLASKPQTIDPTVIPARLNTEETKILNRRLHAEAITLLKNHHNIIPLTRLDEKQVGVVSIGSNACRGSFAQMMRRYDGVTVAVCPDKSKVDNTRTKVSGCNLLVVAVSSTKEADAELARAVCKGKRYILAFFTSPYTMSLYKDLIKDAEAVVLGYENTQLAGEATAEVIYGGLPAMGSLSVSVPDLYKVGAGLHTSKIRMGYRLPEEEGLSSQKLDKIETIVNEGINEGAFPGCQIVIVKGGNVVYNRAFGSIDQDTAHRVTEETLYDLASVTKAMATVPAVMLMRDARKLELGTKLSSLIPALAARHDKKPLTVREALFHETGLPASYPFYKLTAGMTSDTLSERCSLPVARGIFIDPAFRDTMTQKIASLTLKNRGSYLYSDLNFILLRQAVEKASGKPIDQLLAAELYRPLGAWSVGFNPTLRSDSLTIAPTEDDKTVRRQLLCGYVHDEAAAFSGGVEGNAGLFANANDLAKVAEMWLEGGEYGGERFFSPETVKLFTQTKSPKSRRGLGFDKPNMSDSRLSPTCRQAPGSTFGHTGFTGTCFWVDPDNDMAYIFLCNRVYPTRNNPRLVAGNYRTRIQEVIYEAMNQK